MRGSYTSSPGTNIQRFCQFDKFRPRGVGATEKHRHLNPNARGGARLGAFRTAPIINLLKA